MKKLVFISTIVLILITLLLIIFFSNNTNIEYNEELLKLSENFDSKEIVLCEEIPMKEIYVSNCYFSFLSRPFFYNDIKNLVKIDNVQKTKYGFNIIFKSRNETLLVAIKKDGQIDGMANFSETLYKSEDCLKIKKGMTLEEIKKLFPNIYLITENSKIFDSPSIKFEEPYIEFVCDDGTFFMIDFIEKDGVYFVKDILSFEFLSSDSCILKSWKKLIKKMS